MKKQFNPNSGTLSQDRREFLAKAGSLSVMSMFGISFFTACGSSEDMDPSSPSNPSNGNNDGISVNGNLVSVDLNEQVGLKTSGGWLLITSAKVLVVNTGNNDFNALTSICTHQNCDTNWSFQSNQFICGCHGSRFNVSGSVENGPASTPLKSYTTSVQDDILTITKG
ncbi:ubiquinol-cytochrome c reductase iron-sulfur subunit [Echinicola sp. 20G]|uniref:QcrA and Rieske domain-containing protein n=1 Tax=Echinicola sp. 20G TaxID=2781961 RepID=UPI0019108B10|nr:Rieske 2Fe-2S domain-containing protein [Echinicola sp. 20G]